MSTIPAFGPKARFFDANGDPLSGGKLYSYAAGTSTPLDTYTTRDGSVANANPVILDANGEADIWATDGVLYKFILKNSADVTQWTVDNVPSGTVDSSLTGLASSIEPGGRLSLSSNVPVTTSDVTGATTVYYVPYKHSQVPLYDGTSWQLFTMSAQLSQTASDTTKSPAAAAISSNYDMFVWNDSGTLRVSRGPAWSSATSRGTGAGTTELELVGQRYVNKNSISNGPAAQRGLYVGTIRTPGSGATFEDSRPNRYVWNAFNRLKRMLRATDSATTSWNYTTNTYRQANADTGNELDFVIGLSEEQVSANVQVDASNASGSTSVQVNIGLDSATTEAADSIGALVGIGATAARSTVRAVYEGFPGIGKHALVWLEKSGATGTTQWLLGSNNEQGGIWGHLFG